MDIHKSNGISTYKSIALIDLLKDYKKVYIQPHNIPDPDAIASAYGMYIFLMLHQIDTEIIYVDSIEKSNSKQMIEIFNIPMSIHKKDDIVPEGSALLMVDTQPGGSNINSLADGVLAIIDHHNDVHGGPYAFSDIRPEIGACSTIVASYFISQDLVIDSNLATALVYGIMNDTNNLTRLNNKLDLEMFYYLYDIANLHKIKSIKMNEIGRDDIQAYAKALQNIEIYKDVGFVHIEECNDSLLGTISDMVYTIEDVFVVVSYARREEGVKLSIRSGIKGVHADLLVKYIIDDKGVGGGHKEMAGGFIPTENLSYRYYSELDTYIRYKTLAFIENERG